MESLKSTIEQLEERPWQEAWEQLCCASDDRSEEDVVFCCANGYLPEVAIRGRSVTSTWKKVTWEEYKRFTAGRSVGESEFFVVNGNWPAQVHPGGDNAIA